LANWDKKGVNNEQFLKAYDGDGKQLKEKFAIDFTKEKLGRAHQMVLNAYSLYSANKPKASTMLSNIYNILPELMRLIPAK
jgi:selenium-binding protein 1